MTVAVVQAEADLAAIEVVVAEAVAVAAVLAAAEEVVIEEGEGAALHVVGVVGVEDAVDPLAARRAARR